MTDELRHRCSICKKMVLNTLFPDGHEVCKFCIPIVLEDIARTQREHKGRYYINEDYTPIRRGRMRGRRQRELRDE